MQQVKTFRLEVIAQARKRNEEHHDIESLDDFEFFIEVAEKLGAVLEETVKRGASPDIIGRSMLYYAKCVAAAFVKTGIVPEAKAKAS